MCLCINGDAKVYSLRSSGDRRGAASSAAAVCPGADLLTFLHSRNIFTQAMVINGLKTSLRLGLIDMPLPEILLDLQRTFPGAEYVSGGNTLLIKHKIENGWQQRLLLLYFGERFPVLQFSMLLPPAFPAQLKWPVQLPITTDGRPLRVMAIPSQYAFYGCFRTQQHPAAALSEMTAGLRADGWLPFTGEAAAALHGKGEIFIRKQPLAVMLVNVTKAGIATVYTRPCIK